MFKQPMFNGEEISPVGPYDTPRQALTASPEQIPIRAQTLFVVLIYGQSFGATWGHLGPPLQHPSHADPAILCPEWLVSLFHI